MQVLVFSRQGGRLHQRGIRCNASYCFYWFNGQMHFTMIHAKGEHVNDDLITVNCGRFSQGRWMLRAPLAVCTHGARQCPERGRRGATLV